MDSSASSSVARAATRILDILELFAQRPDGLTLSEAAAELGVPVSSLHALMHALAARDYLRRGANDRRFTLGTRLIEVGLGYLDLAEPLAAARRAMQAVVRTCGETAHVAVLSDRDVVYLAGERDHQPLGVAIHVGARVPAYATAAGKALLARLSDNEITALHGDSAWPPPMALTSHAPTSLDALWYEVEEIRWTGYAYDVDGVNQGVHSIAAVLSPDHGRTPAALTVMAPTARLQNDSIAHIIATIRSVAQSAAVSQQTRPRPLIGWSLATLHNDTYREMRRAASTMMARLGGRILWTDAHDNEHKQMADVRRILEERPDALIIQPVNAVSADALFVEARRQGVLVACFQRPARSRSFDFFAGGHTYQEGCMQAHSLVRAMGARGDVLIVEGDPYNDNARNIAQGNRDTLTHYPDVHILDSQPSGLWSRDTARLIVQDTLEVYGAERLRGIIAANDDMAVGVIDVLAGRGLAGQIAVVAGDGDRTTLDLIRSGILTGTAFQDPATLATTTLGFVTAIVDGRTSVDDLPLQRIFHAPAGPPVRVLDVPYTWIDASTLAVLEDYWSGHEAARIARLSA